MKNIWIISIVGMLVLISGCAYQQKTEMPPTATPTVAETPAITPTPAMTQAQTPATASVEIKSFAFNPATLTISKGTIVTWTHQDTAPHTVTENGNVFDSGRLTQGQTFSHTFNVAGTFEYHCSIHPSMKGKVIST